MSFFAAFLLACMYSFFACELMLCKSSVGLVRHDRQTA